MKIKVISTEAEYDAALARIEHIFDANPGTEQGDELDLLSLLVEHYESGQYELPSPDPIGAIRFRMEQQGLKSKDLVPIFGTAKAVRDTLDGRRKLTLSNVRRLHQQFGIPVESLIQSPSRKLRSRSK